MTPIWLDALSRPEAYPERPGRVDRLETHISWLFFAGDHVYKLKKPVDFGFVNYTGLSRRRHFCQEELRLNRRLAAPVYLAVQPVVQAADGRIRIGGEGKVLEYAVQMRRLPAEGMLTAVLRGQGPTEPDLARLCRVLVDFHARAERGPEVAAYGAPARVHQLMMDNFNATRPLVGPLLPAPLHHRLESHAQARYRDLEGLLARRAASGHIVDGHGDLHAGNICFTDTGIVIYDCIEFSPALRCADVACDLAFLSMDLQRAGCWDLARRLREDYADQAGDPDLPVLLDFYQGYRAMVRSKVAGLRWQQADGAEDRRQAAAEETIAYARLALSYALQPVLILCSGLPGSGKTHLSGQLAHQLGLQRLSSDELRQSGPPAPGYGQQRYSPAQRDAVYRQLAAQARSLLLAGQSVIIDASCSRRAWRDALAAAAIAAGRPWLLLEVSAPSEIIRARLRARQARGEDRSEADFAVYRAAAAERESPREVPDSHLIRCRSPACATQLAATIQDLLLQQ